MFAGKVFEDIHKSLDLHPEDMIMEISKWINIYARYNHWILKFFLTI